MIGLREKYRKITYFMGKSLVSCWFSGKSAHWHKKEGPTSWTRPIPPPRWWCAPPPAPWYWPGASAAVSENLEKLCFSRDNCDYWVGKHVIFYGKLRSLQWVAAGCKYCTVLLRMDFRSNKLILWGKDRIQPLVVFMRVFPCDLRTWFSLEKHRLVKRNTWDFTGKHMILWKNMVTSLQKTLKFSVGRKKDFGISIGYVRIMIVVLHCWYSCPVNHLDFLGLCENWIPRTLVVDPHMFVFPLLWKLRICWFGAYVREIASILSKTQNWNQQPIVFDRIMVCKSNIWMHMDIS